tara:strand:+ start:481 stop:774 length:294 start_codon:yes stop_codon:yes gene_type:complete
MRFLFKFRVVLWSIVAELEHYLYPWKSVDPEMDQFLTVKDFQTGDRYSVLEVMKRFEQRLDNMEDNQCYLQSEIFKINKLDCDLLELKNKIYKNENN